MLTIGLTDLSAPPAIAASKTTDKHSHRFIRTSRLHSIVSRFSAFALATCELTTLVGIDTVSLKDLSSGDFIQVTTSSKHGIFSRFVAETTKII
jgi:hypothetical protein